MCRFQPFVHFFCSVFPAFRVTLKLANYGADFLPYILHRFVNTELKLTAGKYIILPE